MLFAEDGHPVLITGESGVAKELVARAIHRLSRREGKFVSENIAGLDDTLFTDTLFGHTRGAFTDAGIVRKGLVEEAGGSTLFLDEIGDLSIGSQVKLLRLIEEKEYRPLGIDEVKTADARIIIATNVDLEKKLEQGKFRQDLYFRLTHRLHMPPLRERLDDLPLLVDHFLHREAQARGAAKPAAPQDLLPALEYGW
jgi:DNA-binding NtrC family response regulator